MSVGWLGKLESPLTADPNPNRIESSTQQYIERGPSKLIHHDNVNSVSVFHTTGKALIIRL
jgi:hypothetical protein